MKRLRLCLILLTAACTLQAQKKISHTAQTWFGFFTQVRLSNKWGIWFDAHLRTREDYFTNFSQAILRLGGTLYLSDNVKLNAAYAYIHQYPSTGVNIAVPEHRPWQQLLWNTSYPKLRLLQAFRLEERWRRKLRNADELADGWSFSFRLRCNIQALFPLSKKRFRPGTLSLAAANEVFVNAGRQVVNNTFDQNRFFAGLNYHVSAKDNIQFGWMNIFQQLPAGNQYRSTSAVRIFFFHQADLRKKNKQ